MRRTAPRQRGWSGRRTGSDWATQWAGRGNATLELTGFLSCHCLSHCWHSTAPAVLKPAPAMAAQGVAVLETGQPSVDLKVQVVGLHKYVVDAAFAGHFPTGSLFAYDTTLCDAQATVSITAPHSYAGRLHRLWCPPCPDSGSPAPIIQHSSAKGHNFQEYNPACACCGTCSKLAFQTAAARNASM